MASAFLVILMVVAAVTRLWYYRDYRGAASGEASLLIFLVALLTMLVLFLVPPLPWGIVTALALDALIGWVCWTRHMPYGFREYSEARRLGRGVAPEEVPVSLWARPWGIRQWWPDWL